MWDFTPALPAALEAQGGNLISHNSPNDSSACLGLPSALLWLRESSSSVHLKAAGLEPAFLSQVSENCLWLIRLHWESMVSLTLTFSRM